MTGVQTCALPIFIEAIGGWDDKALAEDTEISFRIYMMGYKIKFQPKAVTWEQEDRKSVV